MDEYFINCMKLMKEAIRNVGQPYSEQEKLFPANIPVAEEIALTFDNEVTVRKEIMFEKGIIDKKTYELINQLDMMLNKMSGRENIDLWTFDALENSTKWQECRKVANSILEEMDHHK